MQIEVSNDAHQYISEIVRQAPGEVGGLAYIKLIEPGSFHISEFVMFEQEASAAHVDIVDKNFIPELTRAAENHREDELRCSWHSHGDMDVYFSNTDEKGILEYKPCGMPWFVSLVFNKSGDIASRVDIFDHEVTSQITISDLDYYVDSDSQIAELVKEEIKNKIKSSSPTLYSESLYSSNKEVNPTGYELWPNWASLKEDIEWDKIDEGNKVLDDKSELVFDDPTGIEFDYFMEDLEDHDTVEWLTEMYGNSVVNKWVKDYEQHVATD